MPLERYGVKVISIQFFVPEGQPIVWRGPLVGGAIQQFLRDVDWGELDYLVIDLPPGTSDAQLTLAQAVPISGRLLVTTPQEVSPRRRRQGARDVPAAVGADPRPRREHDRLRLPPLRGGDRGLRPGWRGTLRAAPRARLLGGIPLDVKVRQGGDAGIPAVAQREPGPAAIVLRDRARRGSPDERSRRPGRGAAGPDDLLRSGAARSPGTARLGAPAAEDDRRAVPVLRSQSEPARPLLRSVRRPTRSAPDRPRGAALTKPRRSRSATGASSRPSSPISSTTSGCSPSTIPRRSASGSAPRSAAMAETIERLEGTREKFIGDAVFAVFGWPHAHDDDARPGGPRARSTIRAMLLRAGSTGGEPLEVRIGLATGEVVAAAARRRDRRPRGDRRGDHHGGPDPGRRPAGRDPARRGDRARRPRPPRPWTTAGRSCCAGSHRWSGSSR